MCTSASAVNHLISIRALLAEGDSYSSSGSSAAFISIRALLAEGDRSHYSVGRHYIEFQSAPSLRRATMISNAVLLIHTFQSAPSLRRATRGIFSRRRRYCYFNPRPPCGGRREKRMSNIDGISISIRALLAEGDFGFWAWPHSNTHFNPRPPCGGRPGAS